MFCYLSPLVEWIFYFVFISYSTFLKDFFSIRKPRISIWIICCIFLKGSLFCWLICFLSSLSNSSLSNRNNSIALVILILDDLITFSWVAWFSMRQYYISKLFRVMMMFIFFFNDRIFIPFNLSVFSWCISETTDNWCFIFKWFLRGSITNFIKRSNCISSIVIMKCCLSAFTIN